MGVKYMSDNLSPKDRRKTMQAVRSKKTKIERRLWAMLARMGIKGWRKNAKDVFGKPDVVFDSRRIAIFVDGCFWHGCPSCQKVLPISNHDYWLRKIRRNKKRAVQVNRHLRSRGWLVIHIWEHEFALEEKQRFQGKLRESLM